MPVNALTMGAGVLTIGAVDALTNLSSQTSSVRLIPSVDKGDARLMLSGESISGDRTETWSLEGTLTQDLGAITSTTEWLFEHRGETHVFEFVPSTAKGKRITGTLEVEAIEIGGDVGTKPESDFAFALVGSPVIGEVVAG